MLSSRLAVGTSPERDSLIVLSTLGTFGDVLPFVLLGRRLHSRGHRVVLLANQNHEAFVRSQGFHFVPICAAEDPSSGADADMFLVREAIPAFQRTVDEIGALARDRSNVTIVNRAGNWGGSFASERFGLPHVSVLLQPAAVTPGGQPISHRVLDATNAFRRTLGLTPLERPFVPDSSDAIVSLFPDWFGYPQSKRVEAGRCVGFPFASGPTPPLPADIQAMVGERGPLIVFTAGTNMPGTNFFALAGDFARRTGRPVVALGHDGATQGVEGVLTADFVDHASLFEHAELVVHNGGIGVTAQAMRAGVPQIVVPHVWDQPDNGRRVEELGVGRVIRAAELSGERLIEVFGEIDVFERKAAAAVRRAILRMDAVAEAVEVIERHAGQRTVRSTSGELLETT